MGTSVLHIKTEVECHVYLFDEEKGIAKPGTYFNLEVRKGEQDLLFVSTENEAIRCQLLYEVEDSDSDYRLTIEYSLFNNKFEEATEEELSIGEIDEFGVIYSRDGLQLLKCRNEKLKTYHVKDGCKIIRSGADGSFCPPHPLLRNQRFADGGGLHRAGRTAYTAYRGKSRGECPLQVATHLHREKPRPQRRAILHIALQRPRLDGERATLQCRKANQR